MYDCIKLKDKTELDSFDRKTRFAKACIWIPIGKHDPYLVGT